MFLAIGLLSLVAGIVCADVSVCRSIPREPALTPAKTALTQSMFYLLLPVIAFKGIATIYASVLHSHKRFALVAFGAVGQYQPSSIVVILSWSTPSTRIYAVALGTVIGMLGRAVDSRMGAPSTRRSGAPTLASPEPCEPAGDRRSTSPWWLGAFLMGSTTLVDQSMAAALSGGKCRVSELWKPVW